MSRPQSKEYAEGWDRFERILNRSADFVSCPYPVGTGRRRQDWWTGYLDARTQYGLGEIFDKWGV